MFKIAIIDTETTGHHFEYLYGICCEIENSYYNFKMDIYCNVLFFEYITKNNLKGFAKSKRLNFIINKVQNPDGNWLRKTYFAYKNLSLLKEYKQIIFLTLNTYFPALMFFSFFRKPSFSFSGIYFNPFLRQNDSFKNNIRSFFLKRIIKNYSRTKIFVLNDIKTSNYLNGYFKTTVFQSLEDPVPTFYYLNEPTEKIKFQNDTLTYSMIGTLSRRKGIFEYLEAIEDSNSKDNHKLIGKVDREILPEIENRVQKLKRKDFNIELTDQFLSNEEFALVLDRTDILVMPYLTKGASSGILGHAAFRNKAVIGPDEGLLAEIIKKYKLGITINPEDKIAFAECLKKRKDLIFSTNIHTMIEYSSKNSYNSFAEKLLKIDL